MAILTIFFIIYFPECRKLEIRANEVFIEFSDDQLFVENIIVMLPEAGRQQSAENEVNYLNHNYD